MADVLLKNNYNKTKNFRMKLEKYDKKRTKILYIKFFSKKI